MLKIAVILFPGLNTEDETCREIARAGMKAVTIRWNEAPSKLDSCDGFVIGGGFSYEDRGRAGIIAALDPIMEKIKEKAAEGKPVLGICNGAQILVESGLVPGAEGNKLAMALARNKRVSADGKVLGTGYYNTWTRMKCTVPKGRCMFTWDIDEGDVIEAPIAHGEGRFTTEIEGLMLELKEKGQMVLRYCDSNGAMTEQFPTNPNGAQFNIAALCNPAGNVMAVMPHLERSTMASLKLFSSLKKALDQPSPRLRPAGRGSKLTIKELPVYPLAPFVAASKSLEFYVSLIINDNEAETFGSALKRLGFENVGLKRETHIEIEYGGKPDVEKMVKNLIQSGVLLNANKEWPVVRVGKKFYECDGKKGKLEVLPASKEAPDTVTRKILVREKQDFVGMSKTQTIQNRLKMPEVKGIHLGTLWTLTFPTKSATIADGQLKKILETHLFFNPHRQQARLA